MSNSINQQFQREEPPFIEFIEHSIARILFHLLRYIFRYATRHSTTNRESGNNLSLERHRRRFATDIEDEESETNLE